MEQPKSISFTITGTKNDVENSALAGQRVIANGDKNDEKYLLGAEDDFLEKIKNVLYPAGRCEMRKLESGNYQFYSDQETSIGIDEEIVREAAQNMVEIAPNVEFALSCIIKNNSPEGYDIMISANYFKGKLELATSEILYDDSEEDEFEAYDDDPEWDYENGTYKDGRFE